MKGATPNLVVTLRQHGCSIQASAVVERLVSSGFEFPTMPTQSRCFVARSGLQGKFCTQWPERMATWLRVSVESSRLSRDSLLDVSDPDLACLQAK